MGILGLVLALAAVAVAQWWHGGSLLTLLDGPAFVIVVGGTGGAVILQTPRKYMLSALRQAAWMLFPPQRDRHVFGPMVKIGLIRLVIVSAKVSANIFGLTRRMNAEMTAASRIDVPVAAMMSNL